jgi:hypothetical protein
VVILVLVYNRKRISKLGSGYAKINHICKKDKKKIFTQKNAYARVKADRHQGKQLRESIVISLEYVDKMLH